MTHEWTFSSKHMGIQPQKVAQEWMVKSFLVVFSMEKNIKNPVNISI